MKLSTVTLFKKINLKSDDYIQLKGEKLRKYQLILADMAQDIISVCEHEDIKYHLTGGSALGAFRHQGFIPWDDDMDIDILGDDFDRFIHAFKLKYNDKYWIHTYCTPNYGMTINRIRLKNSIFRGREDINNDECGFFIDLIRIENTYNNIILRYMHGLLCMMMGFFLSCRNFYNDKELMIKIADTNKEIKKIFMIKILIGKLISFWSVNKWCRMTQACYSLCKDSDSRYVSVPAGRNHFFGELYKRADFVETKKIKFEGHMWNVPKEIDKYLKHMYGDYMKIPKESEQEVHLLIELKFPDEI